MGTPSTTFTLSCLVLPIDPLQAHFLDWVIDYTPSSELIGYNWTTPLDVLYHLLLHQNNRNQLRDEACRRSHGRPQTFKIRHHLLGPQLSINSFDTDYLFVSSIECLITAIEWRTGVIDAGQYRTAKTQSTPTPPNPLPARSISNHTPFMFFYERF